MAKVVLATAISCLTIGSLLGERIGTSQMREVLMQSCTNQIYRQYPNEPNLKARAAAYCKAAVDSILEDRPVELPVTKYIPKLRGPQNAN